VDSVSLYPQGSHPPHLTVNLAQTHRQHDTAAATRLRPGPASAEAAAS
jgi:hypothetical protein